MDRIVPFSGIGGSSLLLVKKLHGSEHCFVGLAVGQGKSLGGWGKQLDDPMPSVVPTWIPVTGPKGIYLPLEWTGIGIWLVTPKGLNTTSWLSKPKAFSRLPPHRTNNTRALIRPLPPPDRRPLLPACSILRFAKPEHVAFPSPSAPTTTSNGYFLCCGDFPALVSPRPLILISRSRHPMRFLTSTNWF